jgi:hypothetical protein
LLLRLDAGWKRAWISPLLRFQRRWLVSVAAVLVIVSLTPPLGKEMPKQEADDWPQHAVAYLDQHGIGGRFFTPPDYGTYLTWKLGDKARCYVDTRGFYMPAVLLEDSHYVPQLGPDWQTRLERVLNDYATDYFMLETTGPRGELWRRLQPLVGTDVVYLDRQTVVLRAAVVRRGVQAMEFAGRSQ